MIYFLEVFHFQLAKNLDELISIFLRRLGPRIDSTRQRQSIFPPNLNIFDGFNIGENELKHCSVLSWFFNPSANHCQGQLFLELFLKKFKLSEIMDHCDHRYFKVSVEDNFSEYGRVDISIFNDKFWFIIEAKITANEQDDQINRYQKLLSQKSSMFDIPKSHSLLFFLTRDGRHPTSGVADYCISWKEISEILKKFSTLCKNEFVSLIAIQYSKYIKNNI